MLPECNAGRAGGRNMLRGGNMWHKSTVRGGAWRARGPLHERAGNRRGGLSRGRVWAAGGSGTAVVEGRSGVVAAMMNFTASPFWSRKVRLAVLTLATFIALC